MGSWILWTLLDQGSWVSWAVLWGKQGVGKWLIGHTIGHETRKEDYWDLNSQTWERVKNSEKAALGSQLCRWHWIRERSPWRTSRGKRGILAFPPPPRLWALGWENQVESRDSLYLLLPDTQKMKSPVALSFKHYASNTLIVENSKFRKNRKEKPPTV